ncbi:MAG: hypothetical protein WBY53_20245 [Acidobacteriaceae bacterium]
MQAQPDLFLHLAATGDIAQNPSEVLIEYKSLTGTAWTTTSKLISATEINHGDKRQANRTKRAQPTIRAPHH